MMAAFRHFTVKITDYNLRSDCSIWPHTKKLKQITKTLATL